MAVRRSHFLLNTLALVAMPQTMHQCRHSSDHNEPALEAPTSSRRAIILVDFASAGRGTQNFPSPHRTVSAFFHWQQRRHNDQEKIPIQNVICVIDGPVFDCCTAPQVVSSGKAGHHALGVLGAADFNVQCIEITSTVQQQDVIWTLETLLCHFTCEH